MRRQQEMADDDRDPQDEKGDEIAKEHLAKQRRPIEREEGADAAEGEGHHQAECKGKTCGDDPEPVVHGLQREAVEPRADPLRRLAKQPLDAKAQGHEDGEVQQDLGPSAVSEVRLDVSFGSLELVGQIGKRRGERNNVFADRAEMDVEYVRDRSVRGFLPRFGSRFCLALLLQPILDLGVGEQSQEVVDLRRGRILRFRRRRFPDRGLRGKGAGQQPDRKNECGKANRQNMTRGTYDRFALLHLTVSRAAFSGRAVIYTAACDIATEPQVGGRPEPRRAKRRAIFVLFRVQVGR